MAIPRDFPAPRFRQRASSSADDTERGRDRRRAGSLLGEKHDFSPVGSSFPAESQRFTRFGSGRDNILTARCPADCALCASSSLSCSVLARTLYFCPPCRPIGAQGRPFLFGQRNGTSVRPRACSSSSSCERIATRCEESESRDPFGGITTPSNPIEPARPLIDFLFADERAVPGRKRSTYGRPCGASFESRICVSSELVSISARTGEISSDGNSRV